MEQELTGKKSRYWIWIVVAIVIIFLGVVAYFLFNQDKFSSNLEESQRGEDGTYNINFGEEMILDNGYSIIVNEHVSNYAVEYYEVSLFSPEGELIRDFTQGKVFEYSLRDSDLRLIGTLMFTPSSRSSDGKPKVSVKSFSENDSTLYGTYSCVALNGSLSWVQECKALKEISEECGNLNFKLTDICN